jgi:asparagine synthase (glutamine-hydrolysing)
MCAISGIINLKHGEFVFEKMIATMLRRGPDDAGVWRSGPCALLHTRLAVIDPQRGHQPMRLHWAGEDHVIVYNGELYNTASIRLELERMGHHFFTASDTEVVLHAYAQWGELCLERFNGIFAFGIWEEKRQRLFLARDRMGVKPLFYKLHQDGLLFASEIKTILSYPTVKAELDADGAAEILLLGPGRTPGCGVFRGIQEIEPGYCGYYADGNLMLRRYWQLKDREHRESFEETAQHVRFLVTDAIRRQMVSDVPIGTFLSGGLDSSLISAVCAGEMERRGKRLETFSLDFLENDRYFVSNKYQPDSDVQYIRMMELTLDSNRHWTVLTPEQLMESLEAATEARDLPGMADVDFSLLAFCADIRKEVKVALSGECADEIFGGYPWYRDPEIRALDGFPWAQNTRQRTAFLHPGISSAVDCEAFVSDRYDDTIAHCDILPGTSPLERRMKQMMNLNLRWFMQTLLERKDRMSMYHGLEIRVPYCDHRIAEYLYGVPWEFKEYRGQEKGLLRHAAEGLLPHQVLWRKKSPYPKTYHPRYLELVSDSLRILLEQKDAPIFQIVRREALEDLLTAEYAWPWYGQLMKVPQTIAYMLQVNVWLQKYKISVI